MKKPSGSHVIGVPVTSTAYAVEETTRRRRDRPAANKDDGDRLAVSLTHPSPYASFGYKHGTCCTQPPGPRSIVLCCLHIVASSITTCLATLLPEGG